VECLAKGEYGVLVGWVNGKVQASPLAEVIGKARQIDLELFELARKLD
jgi:6-phosphofructokinase 1